LFAVNAHTGYNETMRSHQGFTIRFHFVLMFCIGLVVLAMTLVTVVIALQAGTRASRETASTLFGHSTVLVQEKLDRLFDDLLELALIGAGMPGASSPVRGNGGAHPDREFMVQLIATHPSLYSVYIGNKDGSFLQVINGSAAANEAMQAPARTAFMLRAISGTGKARTQYWTFLNTRGETLGQRREANPDYLPAQQDWFKGAHAGTGTYLSPPYSFNTIHAPGISAARAIPGTDAVFGADFTLQEIKDFIGGIKVSSGGFLLVYDQDSRLLACSDTAAARLGEETAVLELPGPRAKALFAAARTSRSNLPPDMTGWLTSFATLETGRQEKLAILAAAPVGDFNGPFDSMRRDLLIMSLVTLAIALPVTYLLSRRLTAKLAFMARDADRISRFDFQAELAGHSAISEINQLAGGFDSMKQTIAERNAALDQAMADLKLTLEKQDSTREKLATLVDLGGKLSSLHDINELCEEILHGAMDLTHAVGGSLYLRGELENSNNLEFKIVINKQLVGFDQGGTSGKPVTLKPVPIVLPDGSTNHHHAVADAFNEDKTINIPDAYNYEGHDLSGTRGFDQFTGFRTVSILTVPLKPLGREPIGALQLLNAGDPATGQVIPFSKGIEDLVKALAAQAATALSNQALLEEQARLLEEQARLIEELKALSKATINVIVDAIDAKSPYTGGHNKRVPEIAALLADATRSVAEGPLAGWAARYENIPQQFELATKLHDCGKITTPEYVVDKATKLETIYNRLHEVRTRFEVLLRDARIERHQRVLKGGKKAQAAADAWLAEEEARLQADFAFLAECNLGSESMAPELVERLAAIATRTWTRHFDDTIGISWEENSRIPDEERVPLPATEFLLADKARHRIPRPKDALKRYEKLGFQDPTPDLMYNQGEVYNLGIVKGTLTFEERFKINEHIRQSIVMLTNLTANRPNLGNVVEWAGGHHETLKGTGYPYRRNAETLSIPARILAIADIFEALTAKDRPYKKAKTLSEAVKILFDYKKKSHIDPVLFDLFLSSGVYREYAEKYLDPSQLDEVDVSQYVGKMD
jgi:HD-GYP domain-containing protein (c-di-GMP phosphodiesterase class II)